MKKYLKAIIFGIIFGFLLHKGGVTKYSVLEGQLLLVDFTVAKVILSAITVGMIGFMILHKYGKVELKIKPAKLVANISGGLIFGIGFAFAGYCPGTGIAALGQGDIGVLFYIVGMLVGSYLYAEFSKKMASSIQKIWDRSRVTLPEVVNVRRDYFVAASTVVFVCMLYFSKI